MQIVFLPCLHAAGSGGGAGAGSEQLAVEPDQSSITHSLTKSQARAEVLVLDVKELEHSQHTGMVLDRAMRTRDMDNERFLRKVRQRLDA